MEGKSLPVSNSSNLWLTSYQADRLVHLSRELTIDGKLADETFSFSINSMNLGLYSQMRPSPSLLYEGIQGGGHWVFRPCFQWNEYEIAKM
jgi:hypothetical protein